MNPSRRGYVGQLVTHVSRLGVKAITGKPHKPTTQARTNASTRPCSAGSAPASTRDELQAQVDTFDRIDNTERPHQGRPGRVTPATAWLATSKADRHAPTTTTPSFDSYGTHNSPIRRTPPPACPPAPS